MRGADHQPYSQVALVYACVNAIADNIANVPLLFYTGSRKDRNLVEDAPINALFETPNPKVSGWEPTKAIMTFLSTTSEATWILHRPDYRRLSKKYGHSVRRGLKSVDKDGGLVYE